MEIIEIKTFNSKAILTFHIVNLKLISMKNTVITLTFLCLFGNFIFAQIPIEKDGLKIKNALRSSSELVGSSEHFEFYTNITEEQDYWMEIKDTLENEYLKLSSLWNRPGIADVFDENVKIKIYYSEKEDIAAKEDNSPSWKNGFMDINLLEIYISPLVSEKQIHFYKTISKLAINQFSQLAVYKKFQRVVPEIELEAYFLEGFGLYEMGERPKRDSVVKYLNNNPVPDFNFLTDKERYDFNQY